MIDNIITNAVGYHVNNPQTPIQIPVSHAQSPPSCALSNVISADSSLAEKVHELCLCLIIQGSVLMNLLRDPVDFSRGYLILLHG